MLPPKLRAISPWLAEAQFVWYALSVLALSGLVALRPGTPEAVIRLTGLVLQLLGICTVAWGISETRALYGHKPLYAVLVSWAKRFPLLGRSAHVTVAVLGGSATFVGGRAHGTIGAGAGATLEQRIEALEKNLPLIHARISAAEDDLDTKIQLVTDKVTAETRDRKSEDELLAKRLESTATGGVHISAIGAVWLFFGVILSTAAIEIERWLR
jgi:hypothetical protein